ncbi:hypothetical protein ACJD0Z_03855 [Flavobacteriaceae bacterium M23B6Z8]
MERHKVENEIREKLGNREIKPSDDSWSRLEALLPEAPVKPRTSKHWFWLAAAAVIAVVFMVNYLYKRDSGKLPANEIPLVESQNEDKPVLLKENTTNANTQKEIPAQVAAFGNENQSEKKSVQKTIVVNTTKSKTQTAITESSRERIKDTSVVPKSTFENTQKQDDAAAVAIYEEAKRIQELNGAVTEEAIDNLILNAQRKLKLTKALESNSTSQEALALLEDVEEELDETFRDKVFELLKQGMVKVKTAVVDRNKQ